MIAPAGRFPCVHQTGLGLYGRRGAGDGRFVEVPQTLRHDGLPVLPAAGRSSCHRRDAGYSWNRARGQSLEVSRAGIVVDVDLSMLLTFKRGYLGTT